MGIIPPQKIDRDCCYDLVKAPCQFPVNKQIQIQAPAHGHRSPSLSIFGFLLLLFLVVIYLNPSYDAQSASGVRCSRI